MFAAALTNVVGDSKVKVNNSSFEIWEEENVRNFQLGHYVNSDVPASPFANPPETPSEVVAIFRDAESPSTRWGLLHSHQLLFKGLNYSAKFSPQTIKIMDNETEIDNVLIQQDVVKVQDENGHSAAIKADGFKLNGNNLIQKGTTDIGVDADLPTGCLYFVYTNE
jgi:hypothetical protein